MRHEPVCVRRHIRDIGKIRFCPVRMKHRKDSRCRTLIASVAGCTDYSILRRNCAKKFLIQCVCLPVMPHLERLCTECFPAHLISRNLRIARRIPKRKRFLARIYAVASPNDSDSTSAATALIRLFFNAVSNPFSTKSCL